MSAIGHVVNYFIEEKNRDIFSACGIGADWAKFALLSEGGKEVAERISSFAEEAWGLFVWPQLMIDVKGLFVAVKGCFEGPAATTVKQVFLDVITLVGTGCEAIEHLHTKVKVIDVVGHIPLLRGVSYATSVIVDIHDCVDTCVSIYQNRAALSLSLLKLAKLVISVALTALSAWSFFSGVVVLPTLTLVLSTGYLGLKILIWQP